MDHFTEALRLEKYTLYMQDYGGPVGFRMVLAHPERVEALIVQDAVAHNEGLGATGRPGGRSGRTARRMRRRCGRICSRWRPRGRGMSAMIRIRRSMIRICGRMNTPF